MVDNVIKDLNHREYLIWTTHFEAKEDHDDTVVFNLVNPENIGAKFEWSSGPDMSGISTIALGSTVVDVHRTPSTPDASGYWTRVTEEEADEEEDEGTDTDKGKGKDEGKAKSKGKE